MFLILPIILISITYFVLLVKEENHRRLTATILKKQSGLAKDLTITRNYITPCLAIIAFLLTILPFFVVGQYFNLYTINLISLADTIY